MVSYGFIYNFDVRPYFNEITTSIQIVPQGPYNRLLSSKSACDKGAQKAFLASSADIQGDDWFVHCRYRIDDMHSVYTTCAQLYTFYCVIVIILSIKCGASVSFFTTLA